MDRLRIACGFCVVFCGVSVAHLSLARECPQPIHRVAGGEVNAVAASGSHVVYVVGTTLLVADVSAPEAPWVVGQVALPGAATAIDVVGGMACVVTREGLVSVDVAVPAAPVVVGRLDLARIGQLAVGEGHGFAVDSSDDVVRVLDLGDAAHMAEIAQLRLSAREPVGVAVVGDILHVTSRAPEQPGALHLFDVSSPWSPVPVGELAGVGGSGSAPAVVASAGHAYLVHGDDGLRVIDVSDPSMPRQVGSLADARLEAVTLFGDLLAGFAAADTVAVVDVSNPAAPALAGSLDGLDGWGARRLVMTSGTLFATRSTTERRGLGIIDLSVPSSPAEVGTIGVSLYRTKDVEIVDHYAYVTSGGCWYGPGMNCPPSEMGLLVFDLLAPDPTLGVGAALPGTRVEAVAVANGFAYVRAEDSLRVVDVSVPSAPVEVGEGYPISLDDDLQHAAILAAGDHVFAVDGFLQILDVSDPAHPSWVAEWRAELANVYAVAVEAGLAYVASSAGLHVLDVAEPAHPVEVGFVHLPMEMIRSGIDVADGRAFVANGDRAFVVDVVDPGNPVFAGMTTVLGDYGAFIDVRAAGEIAFVSSDDGVRVLDWSDPALPVEIGGGDLPAAAVALAGSYGVVAGDGLEIFRLGGCVPPPTLHPMEDR